ncbi:hypothetical protein IFM89_014507 [Coptis chinensis]|uniref:Amidase domain-containing protein n=1 Tax=Coptis chinensis TaxID=261450 RepID=A0A835IP32_9MAGN|nr:hypothetical protein IFM89_014507 [Coptis chinensis]
MAFPHPILSFLILSSTLLTLSQTTLSATDTHKFSIKEATTSEIQNQFKHNKLTSKQLVKFYLDEIHKLNSIVNGIIEVNPDALYQAHKADKERQAELRGSLSRLHGIPILLKDNISTKDKLNTTAGSFALLGSIVPQDAGVVKKLRKAGAIILGKTNLNEWAGFRSLNAPNGWSARGSQGKRQCFSLGTLQNPYVLSADPCGSSSGSAISVAANMVSVSLGTETDGSILCPSSSNSVVGIKPTVGLTSRSGVIPISPRQDTIGPICRTVTDAVYVLDAIVGFDPKDAKATRKASKFIPHGGAILVDNLNISNVDIILNSTVSGEALALVTEFKLYINAYLEELVTSPVRSLADIIAFNDKVSDLEMIDEFGQEIFLISETTNGFGDVEKQVLKNLKKLSEDGLVKLMKENKLDALVTPGADIAPVLAIGGFPGINVPAGYDTKGVPFGINFGGLKGSEPKLIEIAYSFEQATKIRKPPSFKPYDYKLTI